MKIEEFAKQHDLTMMVNERAHESKDGKRRFYAHFRYAHVSRNGVMEGSCGNGATEKEAIANYAMVISDKLLVVDAFTYNRREIQVPSLK